MAISFLPLNNYPEDLVTKSLAALNNSLLESKLRIRKTKPQKLYSMCLVCIPAYFHSGLREVILLPVKFVIKHMMKTCFPY